MKSHLAPVWLARLVLAVYLATAPVYGMAVTLAALACQSEATIGAAQETKDHPQGTHSHSQSPVTSHDHVPHAEAADSPDHDSRDGGDLGHLCCQLVVTALPSQASPVEPEIHSPLPSSPDVFHYVAFLERFHRPPLG